MRKRARIAPATRFWRMVDMHGAATKEPQRDACWPWRGAVAADTGYGIFNAGELGTVTTHTFVFDLTRKTTAADRRGLVVRHTCDNRLCCNPLHLRLGSHADNTRDMDERGRRVNNPVKGEAHHGSKLTAEAVREARREFDQLVVLRIGDTQAIKQLAEKHGVAESTMRAVIERRTWKHV